MKILPGTHRGETILPRETYDENLLSRGQTIRNLDISAAVDMPPHPADVDPPQQDDPFIGT